MSSMFSNTMIDTAVPSSASISIDQCITPSPITVIQGNNPDKPKSKRIACVGCRGRKLKCDGARPRCASCIKSNHSCTYEESRRKSGPKRGYVKALEQRLKHVETLLNRTSENELEINDPAVAVEVREQPSISYAGPAIDANDAAHSPFLTTLDTNPALTSDLCGGVIEKEQWNYEPAMPNTQPLGDTNYDMISTIDTNMNDSMNDVPLIWELIGLGLDEPLPLQETIDALHDIYFNKVHPSLPMLHKHRYLAAMYLAPAQRPPICLRYAMWTMACSVTDKYSDLKEHFYLRAKKYMERDTLKGHGESMISLAHCQTHLLLSAYEFKMMYFPRAWMSTGAASRLAQMMGLHRLDGEGLDIKQCLPPPRDWTEREERRRTFWMAFCEDRYASIGTGWPLTFDEKDIMTNLPASDHAYENGAVEETQNLEAALLCPGAMKLSSFGGVVLLGCLFGRNLLHLHRPDKDEASDRTLEGEFWKRHRNMDNILLNISLNLPWHLRLPAGLASPNIVFTNMNIHTATICLHQAAIFKADKNNMSSHVSKESKMRCLAGANEIASIMKMIAHLDLDRFNPFMCFCLYVAARVFVQYLRYQPDDSSSAESLRFLLQAMSVLKCRNPLAESFLVQLDVDLELLRSKSVKFTSLMQYTRGMDANKNDSTGCPSLNAQPERLVVPGRIPYIYAEASKPTPERAGCTNCRGGLHIHHITDTSVNVSSAATSYEDVTNMSRTTPASSATSEQFTFDKFHPVTEIQLCDSDLEGGRPDTGGIVTSNDWEMTPRLGEDDMLLRMMMGIDPVWQ